MADAPRVEVGKGHDKQAQGARVLLGAGVVFVVVVILFLIKPHGFHVAGAMLGALDIVPTLWGLALWLSGGVQKRAASGKPFA